MVDETEFVTTTVAAEPIDPQMEWLLEAFDEAVRVTNRETRIEQCGVFLSVFNPQSGMKEGRAMNCNYFRDCIKCLFARIEEFRQRLLNAEQWAMEDGLELTQRLFDNALDKRSL